jgi:hypothetical protein
VKVVPLATTRSGTTRRLSSLLVFYAFLIPAYVYGFFPTAMRTVAEVPLMAIGRWKPVISGGGTMLQERSRLSSSAACIDRDHLALGSALRLESDSGDSIDTVTPVPKPIGTAKFATSLPNTLIDGKPGGGFTLFHPALCKTSSSV